MFSHELRQLIYQSPIRSKSTSDCQRKEMVFLELTSQSAGPYFPVISLHPHPVFPSSEPQMNYTRAIESAITTLPDFFFESPILLGYRTPLDIRGCWRKVEIGQLRRLQGRHTLPEDLVHLLPQFAAHSLADLELGTDGSGDGSRGGLRIMGVSNCLKGREVSPEI